jgi:hypothetical protein
MIWIYIVGAIVVLFGFVVLFGAPYVPSHRRDVRRVFEHLQLDEKDLLVDVGSGDGLVLRAAARRGVKRAIGFELNPALVFISRLASLRYPQVSVKLANFWYVQLPKETTLVYAFSVGRDRKKLARMMQAEANRLGRSVKLLCYANPFTEMTPIDSFEAYSLYEFRPLHAKEP